jgi:hypothetical protein
MLVLDHRPTRGLAHPLGDRVRHQGLLWLGLIGVVLFLGTAAIGAVRRRSLHR